MQPITPTLRFNDSGLQVTNLQEALLSLSERGAFNPDDVKPLTDKLSAEQAQQKFGEITTALVRRFQIRQGLGDHLGGEVEETTAARLNELLKSFGLLDEPLAPGEFVVRGVVRDSNGKPMPEVKVRAFDRDLRKEQPLGAEVVTNAEGRCEIRCTAEQFADAEARSQMAPDLIVRAYDAGDKTLAESPTHFNFNVGSKEEIILIVPVIAISKWEKTNSAILPLLVGQMQNGEALAPADLTDADLDFLASDTGLERANLRFFALGFVLTRKLAEITTPSGAAFELMPLAFYGWLHKGQSDDLSVLRQQAPATLRRALLEAVEEHLVPFALKGSVDELTALLNNPHWQELKKFATAIEMEPAKQAIVLQHFDRIEAIDDLALAGLVQTGALAEADADRLGLAASVQQLLQCPVDQIGVALSRKFDSLNRPLKRSDDLARLTSGEWVALLESAAVEPPAGQSVEEFAREFEEAAVGAFPTVGLLHRAKRLPAGFAEQFGALKPDNDSLRTLWALPLNDPAAKEIAASLPKEQQQAWQSLHSFARGHRGLATEEISLETLRKAGEQLTRDLGQLIEANPGKDLLSLDLSVVSEDVKDVNFGTLPKESLLKELKGMQRALNVAEHPTIAQTMQAAGMHTAAQVALITREEFAEKTGLPAETATPLHKKAKDISQGTAHTYFALKDAARDQRMIKGAAGIGEVKHLDLFKQLFGNMDYCDCAHCLSVLSPSAYFVDLMCYIERYIAKPADDENSLKARRGDLWTLPLTCKNALEYMPTLDIVNKILEDWLVKKESLPSSEVLFTNIACSEEPSFRLPVHFPLERLEILLAHFGLSRDRVAQALGLDAADRVRTRLKLSRNEVAQITDSQFASVNASDTFYKLLGIGIIGGPDTPVADDLSSIQTATGLDRDVVRHLLTSNFVRKDGSANPKVEIRLVASLNAVQNDIEQVKNLTLRRLDRLHRLIRLWRKLPWTVGELDYVLERLALPATVDALDQIPEGIVQLLDLSDRFSLPVDELMSLWNEVPKTGLRGDVSLFDRRFNAEPFRSRDGEWPIQLPSQLKHPSFDPIGKSDPDKNILARILAALQINNEQFVALVKGLAEANVANDNDRQIKPLLVVSSGSPSAICLTSKALDLLYRHAKLARLLGLKPAELMRMLPLIPELGRIPQDRVSPTTPLLSENDSGPQVANLQEALLALYEKKFFKTDSPPPTDDELAELIEKLKDERVQSLFGKNTSQLVLYFQMQEGMGNSFGGVVEAKTATRLNRQLKSFDLLDEPGEFGFVKSLSDVLALLRFAAEQRASGYSLEEIDWLLHPPNRPANVRPASEIAAAVTQRITQERKLVLSDSAFTAIGMTEEQSQAAFQTLEARLFDATATPREYRLKPSVALNEIEAGLGSTLEDKVEESAVLSLARHLGEFKIADFAKELYISPAVSQQIVDDNLASSTQKEKPFIQVSIGDPQPTPPVPPTYRLNPAFGQAEQRPAWVLPANLADTMVRGFLNSLKARNPTTLPETLFEAIHLSAQESHWLVAANLCDEKSDKRAFVRSPSSQGVLLNQKFFAGTAPQTLILTGLVTPKAVELMRGFHWSTAFDEVAGAELATEAAIIGEFRRFDPPEQQPDFVEALYGNRDDLKSLTEWIARAQRLRRLFKAPVFNATAVHFVLDRLTGTDGALYWWEVQSVAAYAGWLARISGDSETASRRRATVERLIRNASGQDDTLQDLADALEVSLDTLRSASALAPPAGTPWFDRLKRWGDLLEIMSKLGVSGETLNRMRPLNETAAAESARLWRAADDIYGAFRAKYPDQATFREKSEAFEDLIRGRRRDALVAYLTAKYASQGASQLYAQFLMDVEAGGCARTSRLVAATASLQLYVHRVLMGLEGVGFTEEDARQQWVWRKNYRVWEVNREVFLSPEIYIEPDLRDDKTPLFRELEDELLQRQITNAEAEESYTKYLAGYVEVAGLKIVGAFHDLIEDEGKIVRDTLHLIGATTDDPPQHFHRQILNTKWNQSDLKGHPIQFTPWEKLSVAIPVKWVSPVVFERKLMLFWIEITTVPTSRRIEGQSYFDGYEHKYKVKFVQKRADGSWTPAQEVKFGDGSGHPSLLDPLMLDPVTQDAAFYKAVKDPAFYNWVLRSLEKDQNPEKDVNFMASFQSNTAAYKFKGKVHPRFDNHHHGAPREGYQAVGPLFERVFPAIRREGDSERLQLVAMNGEASARGHGYFNSGDRTVLFVDRNLLTEQIIQVRHTPVIILRRRAATPLDFIWVPEIAEYQNPPRIAHSLLWPMFWFGAAQESQATQASIADCHIVDSVIINKPVSFTADHNQLEALDIGFIISTNNNTQGALYFGPASDKWFHLRLSTSNGPKLNQDLNSLGLPKFLSLQTKLKLGEQPTLITAGTGIELIPKHDDEQELNFNGPYGTYLREVFFHIPFLIANHLNSQQRFAESQQWYHYIFNPMSSDAQPWRYLEFASLSTKSLKEALRDPAALAAYRNDPFNPHAIARLRLSAYQKAIAMKYIDNLLDWGDRLFSQFTMESVNEATMLYVLAADILGERPQQLPKCAEEKSRTYNEIRPALSEVSDFLIEEIETLAIDTGNHYFTRRVFRRSDKTGRQLRSLVGSGSPTAAEISPGVPPNFGAQTGATIWTSSTGTSLSNVYSGEGLVPSGGFTTVGPGSGQYIGGNIDPVKNGVPPGGKNVIVHGGIGSPDIKHNLFDAPPPHREYHEKNPPTFDPIELVPARNVFCFPANQELLAYWDRVEDRLFKIRNCMDIAGVRRRLELFAPEIDPRLLVRMKAAGLSLEDVLDSGAGHAPPYRFTFLLEKARQYAATAQGMGSQLLSALEKRDAEELAALRTVHEQHLLELRSKLMQWEIDAANDALDGLQKQKEAAEYRQEHFEGLISGGLSGWEMAQSAASVTAILFEDAAFSSQLVAAIAHLLPQVYSPTVTAVTTEIGGQQVAGACGGFASAFNVQASIANTVGSLAGQQASFQRREEEWKHQVELAKKDVSQIGKQIEAAEIRVSIAERSVEVHQKSIEQTHEVYAFYREKFTNHGLYTWMSTQLHRLHRLSFNSAWSIARMAERALHFERPDLRDSVTLEAPTRDANRTGLLAGESLLLELQRMEMRFLETNYRELEVEQSFSLAQFSADKLMDLRATGECEFAIPEFFFDLYYPGHYRRRIKAVRVTIPCVVGPHTSVGATLTMTASQMRDTPNASAPLKTVPLRFAPSIATSSAQNDAGVFELNFRDERFMPFEGLGAISTWKLTLPKAMPSFNYDTISDVILRINYTALEDGNLRYAIDQSNEILLNRLQELAPTRVFSVRHDFPTEWAKFQGEPPSASQRYKLTIPLRQEHYPFWSAGHLNSVKGFKILVQSNTDPIPPNINIYARGNAPETGAAGERTDILERQDEGKWEDWLLGSLTGGTDGIAHPLQPDDEVTLFFDDRSLKDIWIIVSWSD